MAALRVRVGTGTGLVARKGAALLYVPEPAENSSALLESFRSGEPVTMLDSIGETVVAEGFTVAPFALVVVVDSKVQLRVFGDLEVTTTLRTAPMLSGKGSGTWVDHFGALIDEVTVHCGEDADERTDLIEGTVLGGGIELIVAQASPPPEEPAVSETVSEAEAPVEPEPVAASLPEAAPEPEPEHEPEPEPYNQAHLLEAFEDETPTPQADWAPPAPPVSMPPPPGATDLVTPVESHTLVPEMAGALRAELTSFVLAFDDGSAVDVADSIVLGRKPIVEDVREVGVPVEGDRVSRTHLRVGVTNDDLFVTDLNSRNGSAVVWAETGEPEQLVADTAMHIGIGDRVVFGSQAFTVQAGEKVSDD